MDYRVLLSNGYGVLITDAASGAEACRKAEDESAEAMIGGEQAEAVEVQPITPEAAKIDGFVSDFFALEAIVRKG